jgi:hypothetical protein
MKEAANGGGLTQAGFARFSISSIAAEYMAANSLSHFALAGLSGPYIESAPSDADRTSHDKSG